MAVRFRDYYEILGVERGADAAQIRRAFRNLARKYHPDVSKETDAAARFKEINEAYEVLKDPEKRARYDQLGHGFHDGQEFRPPPGFGDVHFDFGGGTGGPSGFSEFFEMLFGRGFGGGRGFEQAFGGAGARRSRRGQDVEAELPLTLAELRHGGRKSVSLVAEDGAQRSYDVRIPPGTTEGTRIRLGGQGGAAGTGGEAGDLFLRVRIESDPRFERDGFDVRTTIDLAPWEAALGARVTVPTLDGEVELTIPPGTPSGRTLRLRGLGLLREKGGQHGDQLVRTRIVVPGELTADERRLFEELAAKSRFRPRGERQ
ncbi:MAG: DnaJ domain-containing protein [Planctomycetes bacterium]|nr:DnaJ domain-containing protein [Planctomycetota bacterium]